MLEIACLGPLQVMLNGRPVEGFVSTKAQALLCYLAVSGGEHSREALAGLLWPDFPEENARTTLRVVIANLRKLLPDYFLANRLTVSLDRKQPHRLDTAEFSALTRAGAAATVEALETAARLWRGDFLHDFHIADAQEFDEWLLTQRTYWQHKALATFSRLADHYLQERAYGRAIAVLRQLLTIEPWQESAHRQLMLALSHQGDFNGALAQYDLCRRLLDEELGVEPMPETTALYERIQVARRGRPPTIPPDGTPLIGRQQELAQLLRLIHDPACRLITITGLGGIGKTRLALAAARRANHEEALHFLNGVAFVPLAGLSAAAALPLALADALDISLSGQVEPLTEVTNFLQAREMLLALDNFEHLIDGVGLLNHILQSCPDIKLLVTSREPLNLSAEWRVDLEGLGYPLEIDELELEDGEGGGPQDWESSYPAVQLFLQAAQQVRPSFRLNDQIKKDVVQLCQLLAGVPLAIRLAAAWLRAMPVAEVVREVAHNLDLLATTARDVPLRQRSMRAVFDQTWLMLSDEEQEVFQTLAVFRGSFTAEAAVQVAGKGKMGLWLLTGLVDRGLVQFSEASERYLIHEVVRQYAAEKLEMAARQTTVADRHSRYYLGLVANQERSIFGAEPQAAVVLLRRDMDNIRQAWLWATERQATGQETANTEVLASFRAAIDGLAAFYEVTSLFEEGQSVFALSAARLESRDWRSESPHSAIPNPQSLIDRESIRCQLLARVAEFAEWRGDFEQARATALEVIRLADRLELPRYRADALRTLGILGRGTGQVEQSIQHLQEAIEIYRPLSVGRPLAVAYDWLGLISSDLRRLDEALDALGQAAALYVEVGDERGMIFNQGMTGVVLSVVGRLEESLAYQQEVLVRYQKLDYPLGVARTANNVGIVLLELGEFEEAVVHLDRAVEIALQIGSMADAYNSLSNKGEVHLALDEYDEARRCFQRAGRFFHEAGMKWLESENLWRMGQLLIYTGEYERAHSTLDECLALTPQDENPETFDIAHGLLAEIAWRSGHLEQALAHFDRAIEMYHAVRRHLTVARFVLLPRAALLLELGDVAVAEQTVVEIQPLLKGGIGRNPILFESQLLEAKISFAQGNMTAAQQRLANLLDGRLRPVEEAAVHYEWWRMDGDVAHGRAAAECYQALLDHAANVVYQQRLNVLTGSQ